MSEFVIQAADQTGYYTGYTMYGPVFTTSVKEAAKFDLEEKAKNVISGDERLRGAHVLNFTVMERK